MRPKAIVYSLFGYGKERQANSFDFASYLRGLMINVRMNRLLFPDWEIVLQTDQSTYEAFKNLFDNIGIQIRVNQESPLCLAMLWRMKPIFEQNEDLTWKYSHVLCRDTDSPPTYREAQAVQYWINRDKAMHAITDSISHCVPLLGGMIGARPDYFTERIAQSWDEMIANGLGEINEKRRSKGQSDLNFEGKGTDQTFLNEYVYPRFGYNGHDSITQHYFNGHGNTFLSDFRTCTCPPPAGHATHCYNNLEIPLPAAMKESNAVCGHIGAAGYYETAMFRFLRQHKHQFEDLLEKEREYSDIFYWTKDKTFE